MNPKESSSAPEAQEEQGALGDRYERIKAAEQARKALLARRHYSLRLQIYLGFFLVLLFAAGIATALVLTMYQVEDKLRFLEIVNDFMIEIQQARRFEKNYFLYGTNLSDALENVYKAREISNRNAEELNAILGKRSMSPIFPNLEQYESLLEELVALKREDQPGPRHARRKKEIEVALRKHGQKLVSVAQDLIAREKAALSKTILRSRNVHIYALFFLLIFMAANAYLLGSRILGNINRFMKYASRIAAGDFSPITPARSFRDEFTDLALAINQMLLELERREAVLIQSHKMRAVGTLTAGVAHELNNPLNNITLTAHMLLEDYETLTDEERKEMVEDVVKEADRSRDIISNLLDFARESGAQVETLDLKELLEDTIALASNQIKLSGIKIEFKATDHLPRIHGDSQQLRQVFLNLILNAIDASEKGGKIQVLALPADEPNYVAVKVIDFGKGIPEYVLGSIFDPFFTTKAKGKGTGLGLSVSQGIIAKHGGKIRVHSREGMGATFTVTLPVTTLPAEMPGNERTA
ncbi:MAG: HAMP domain-containing histidine kinase [Deltaproteobacteria bacterium]|nr:HAMP domain-containing histidine kinase [Deltaproteobacteria bacterium]